MGWTGPNVDKTALAAEVARFVKVIDQIYGVYLDSTYGCKEIGEQMAKAQADMTAQNIAPGSDYDSLPYYIGKGAPGTDKNVLFHQTTQGEFKARNLPDGRNHTLLAQYMIVLIYSAWEQEHRAAIAETLGLKNSDQLTLPIMGDMRLLRHDILKNAGVIKASTIAKLEALSGFTAGETITLSEDSAYILVQGLKANLDGIVFENTEVDPLHRMHWRV